MDIKIKNNLSDFIFSPAHFFTCSFSRLTTCSLSHFPIFPLTHSPTSKAFSLVEMLVTLSILAVIATAVGGVYLNVQKQKDYEITMQVMEGIKKAILGKNIPHTRGIQISGYVADMGNLPPLNGYGQPESLWRQGNLPGWEYHKRIWTGWNGPYIERPEGGTLKDGWGRPLIFEKDIPQKGDLTILSYGADRKPGGSGLDEDVILKIKKHHYMAPLGFSFKGCSGDLAKSSLEINYPDPETETGVSSKKLEMKQVKAGNLEFGLFVSDDEEKPLFPIGLRSITADIYHGAEHLPEKVIVFPIQPGMNYMGTIE